jgi:hypothetical protein
MNEREDAHPEPLEILAQQRNTRTLIKDPKELRIRSSIDRDTGSYISRSSELTPEVVALARTMARAL